MTVVVDMFDHLPPYEAKLRVELLAEQDEERRAGRVWRARRSLAQLLHGLAERVDPS